MLRGDYTTASAALIAEVAAGLATVDEARQELGYNGPIAAAPMSKAAAEPSAT